MTDKERRINERSLENLKLGAASRRQGKVRRNTTLLPETIEWLEEQGNVSEMIDQLVAAAKSASFSEQNGQSNHTHNSIDQQTEPSGVSNHTHNSIDQQTEPSGASNHTHNSIVDIDIAEIRRQSREIQALEDELHQVRSQLEDMAGKAGEWYDKAKECEQRLEEHSNQQLLSLEAVRDRILQGLKLGRQAPEYKRTKAILERFIQELQQQ